MLAATFVSMKLSSRLTVKNLLKENSVKRVDNNANYEQCVNREYCKETRETSLRKLDEGKQG